MKKTTDNEDLRWKHLSTVITTTLFVTLCVLLIGASVGFLSIGAIPQSWFILFATALSAATIYVFGEEAYNVFTTNK